MLINLSSDFSNLQKSGIESRFLLGVFFHEWLHYFHNVSTNFGLSTFTSTVSLWQYFHNANINGEIIEHSQYKEPISMLSLLLAHAREHTYKPEDLKSINKHKFESLKIIKAELNPTIISDNENLHSYLCEVISENDPDYRQTIEIRPFEIFENLAYLLEKKLVDALQKKDTSDFKYDPFDEPNVSPYRMIELLFNYFELNLEGDDCIRVMITLLLAVDSMELLNEIIPKLKDCKDNNLIVEAALINITNTIIKNNDLVNRLDSTDEWINTHFPVNDTIGNAIKSVFKILKENISKRYKNPFLEFEILETLELNTQNLTEVFKEYSLCALMKPLPANEIKEQKHTSELITIGEIKHLEDWQQFHAALHFLGLHIGSDGQFMETSKIDHRNRSCPFLNACSEKTKLDNPDICKKMPWKTFDLNNPKASICWYGSGVRQTIYQSKEGNKN